MTTLLTEAVKQTEALPEIKQDFWVALLLANIRDTQEWDAQFAASLDVLEEMYDEAIADDKAGRTWSLDA